jgi:hypothetical protein
VPSFDVTVGMACSFLVCRTLEKARHYFDTRLSALLTLRTGSRPTGAQTRRLMGRSIHACGCPPAGGAPADVDGDSIAGRVCPREATQLTRSVPCPTHVTGLPHGNAVAWNGQTVFG